MKRHVLAVAVTAALVLAAATAFATQNSKTHRMSAAAAGHSACTHCGSPISILDMKQPQQMLEQLKQAAEPRPFDPALPMKLASAKLGLETSLAEFDRSPEWWSDASSSGLVQAGLNAVTRWLSDKLVD